MPAESPTHEVCPGARFPVCVAVALAAALWAGPAAAQTCSTPDSVVETFPASGSRGIPLNGLVKVLYCPSEDELVDRTETRLLRDLGSGEPLCACDDPLAECLEVGLQRRCLTEVEATVSLEEGDEVRLETVEELVAQTTYVIEAPEPAELLRVSFTTGTAVDESTPEFSGLESARIIGCGEGYPANAACPAAVEEGEGGEGFVAILQASAASDEAGLVNLEYLAYQARGEQRILRGRGRGDGAADVTISIFIPASELEEAEWEQLCFDMVARDPYGHETQPREPLCEYTPEFSPFGSLCAASAQPLHPVRQAPPLLLGALVVLVALLGLRASSGRSCRRSGRHSA